MAGALDLNRVAAENYGRVEVNLPDARHGIVAYIRVDHDQSNVGPCHDGDRMVDVLSGSNRVPVGSQHEAHQAEVRLTGAHVEDYAFRSHRFPFFDAQTVQVQFTACAGLDGIGRRVTTSRPMVTLQPLVATASVKT
jgi:hypothetical protein